MNLRGRITLFVSLSILTLAAGIQGAAMLREGMAEARYAEARVTSVRNTWSGLGEISLRRLEDVAPLLAADGDVINATARDDAAALKAAVTRRLAAATGSRVPPLIEVVDETGALLHSDEGGATPAVLGSVILDALAGLKPGARGIRGIAVTARGEAVIAVIEPLFGGSGRIGTLAAFTTLQPLLADLASATEAIVFLVSGDTVAVVGASHPERWPGLDALPADAVTRLDVQQQVLETIRFSVSDMAHAEAVSVLSLRDVTAASHRDLRFRLVTQGLTLGAMALFLAFLYWYMRVSFQPLNAMIRVLNALARGNTRVALPFTAGNDEIGRLAGTVENFRQGQEAQSRLTTLQQDLDLAHRIQASFLSTDFPELERVDIHAAMLPAKEVGGDFYDFFQLPDGRFGVVIADVSGKGVGAAMFMAAARTVIRSTAQVVGDPGACLARANDLLSRENDANMFVTVFYGVFDPASGIVTYANGGHNPPLRLGAAGTVEMLPSSGDMALGVMDGMDYASVELLLGPGEALMLYTDGVTEAFNLAEEEFGERRLRDTVAAVATAGAARMIEALVAGVAAFTDGAPRSDDLTCLVLRHRPPAAVVETAVVHETEPV